MSVFQKTIYFLFAVIFCLLPVILIQGQEIETEIVLTWSTDTYTPPDYYGKALPVKGSSVEVVANIFSREVAPQELIYNWFLDGRIQKDNSGKGKQIFKFNMGETSSKKSIQLEVANEEGSALGQSSYLIIEPREPEIVLGTSASFRVAPNQKKIFIAQPYFFNIKSAEDLNYQWEFGSEKAILTDESSPNILTLEIGQLVNSFTRNLVVKAENKNNPLQKASLTAEINFSPLAK